MSSGQRAPFPRPFTRDHWQSVAPLLTQATRLSDAEARDLVDSAALDAVLRREIMDLLRLSGPLTGPSGNRETMPPQAASPKPPALAAFKPGEAIEHGRFVIVRQIGRGGMGAVYLAQDTALGTLVALKFVPPDDRLIQEAQRAAACAGHEHVATVHNVLQTEHGGERVGVLVMEHVAGRPASRILDDGPIAIARAVAWMRQAASAVAHAHDSEVLHCDLKPGNMIVTPDDRVKVLDFGIARRSFDGANQDEPTYGTLPYMAPEQLLHGECSRATDVYSLGVTLFELITGRLPFTGDDRMVSMQILAAPPPKVSEFAPGVPPALDAVVERALAKDPADRFRSARALVQALDELQPSAAGAARHQPSTALSWLLTPVAALPALLLLTLAFGLVACRSFEVLLQIDSAFFTPYSEYLRIGIQALFPLVVLWVIAAAATAAVVVFVMLIRWRAPGVWAAWSRWTSTLNPQALAVAALLLGVAAWLALLWNNRDLFDALIALHQDPASASVEAISFSARRRHVVFSNTSGFLSFALVLAAVAWFPALRKRAGNPSAIQRVGWAMLLLAVVVMLGPTMPRRLLFERFRVVEHEGRQALAIGNAGEELLLYDSERRVTVRVSRNAAGLRVTERTRQIFEH